MESEHFRYLGTLGLLGECSVYVPGDLREEIERALNDAVEANPHLCVRRSLDRITIEVKQESGS